MPHFNEMPPSITTWPKPITTLAAELAKLQERAAQANRDLVKLTGDGSPGDRDGILLKLRKADEAALSEAARNSETIPDSRPATEQYELDVEAARSTLTATEGAAIAVGTELQAALIKHADAIDAAVIEQKAAAANDYVAAINALEAARHDVKRAAATTSFLELARRAAGDRWVNFSAGASPEMAGTQHQSGSRDFTEITTALRIEAAHYRPAAEATLSAA
jgi:hypothetical protein